MYMYYIHISCLIHDGMHACDHVCVYVYVYVYTYAIHIYVYVNSYAHVCHTYSFALVLSPSVSCLL